MVRWHALRQVSGSTTAGVSGSAGAGVSGQAKTSIGIEASAAACRHHLQQRAPVA
jgi:hypothetical protein